MTINFCKFPTSLSYMKYLLLSTCLFACVGCEQLFTPSIATMCDKYPDICKGLNQDGWCRSEKANVIRHQYDHLKDTNERHKYDLLLKWEKYQVCIEKASLIQHIKYKDKETTRAEGARTAKAAIKRLTDDTSRSSDPYLSFYHWSRYGNETARDRFLAFAENNQLHEPDLLTALASMQIKEDTEKTKWTLYAALSLYADKSDIDPDIFVSLVNIGMMQENMRLTYVWYQIAKINKVDNINPQAMENLFDEANLPIKVLDAVVKDIDNALSASNFDAKKLKLSKL